MDNCIFCKIVTGEISSYKIYENENILAFLDIAPVNIGHTLVIPKKHFINIYETPDELLVEMTQVVKKISVAIKSKLRVDGVNIAMNNDLAAGQVIFHSHIHVIPRIKDDGFALWHGKRPYNEGEAKKIMNLITEGL